MSDKELVTTMISQYVDLLRIKKSANREAEIETQERKLRVSLEAMGVPVDELKVPE